MNIAFYNLQTAFVTDSEESLSAHPKYKSDKRMKTVKQLIERVKPDILGIVEFMINTINKTFSF